jgi:hypothetical protein
MLSILEGVKFTKRNKRNDMKEKERLLSNDLILVISHLNSEVKHQQKKEKPNIEYIEYMKLFAKSVERAKRIIYAIENNLT